MKDAFEDHEGTVSIGSRSITNLRFADDIDGLAADNGVLHDQKNKNKKQKKTKKQKNTDESCKNR